MKTIHVCLLAFVLLSVTAGPMVSASTQLNIGPTIHAKPFQSPLKVDSVPGEELVRYFQSAALQYDVPASLLMSIAYVETRWHQSIPSPDPKRQDTHQRTYTLMGLRDDNWFGHSLCQAATLIGQSEDALLLSPRLSIEGAAAYLHELQPKGSSKDSGVRLVSLWTEALRKYSGIPTPEDSDTYVEDVLRVVHEGASIAGVRIPGDDSLAGMATLLSKLQPEEGEFPGSIWDPSPNIDVDAIDVSYVVIHDTEGSFAGAVSWLKSPDAQVSAHYVIRSHDGLIKQLVKEKDRAWHARCWNGISLGIEHEGFMDSPEYYTQAMYKSSARLVHYLAKKYSVPMDGMHIVGHDFWSKPEFAKSGLASLNCNDHDDPGKYWDWNNYLKMIKSSAKQRSRYNGWRKQHHPLQ